MTSPEQHQDGPRGGTAVGPSAEQVRAAADIALIGDLVARIAQLADAGDLTEYLDQFTQDAIWRMPANPAVGVGEQLRRGRQDIADGSAQRRADGIQGPGSATRHVVTTTTVRPDGDGATAVSYFRFYTRTDTDPRLVSMGTYTDAFARIDGRWLLAERSIGLG